MSLSGILKHNTNLLCHTVFWAQIFLTKIDCFFIYSYGLLKSIQMFQLDSHIMIGNWEDKESFCRYFWRRSQYLFLE